ncbi:MAG: hypothetical protein OXR66_00450 [Candidatus Woesearchaeota archaeon]|nr:hypothetical protein [Candidatus Woesearchaeota archaeon]
MKKGQAALEFLMTYGWMLLVLVAIISVMWYFTGFNVKFFPSTCTVEPPFSCLEYKAQEDGIITFGIQNTIGDVTDVNMTLYCEQPRSFVQTGVLSNQDFINETLVHFSCPVTGSQFKTSFDIIYRNVGEGPTHTASGTIRAHIEP